MALTNSGFNGTVNEAQYAQMWALGGADAVESAAAWAVTQGTGRQVSVAAHNGYAFARGVLSKDTAAILCSLSTPTNGQWFLIVRHINWSTDTVTVEALAHTPTSTTAPTAPPGTRPTMDNDPGVLYDQELAWAWVRSSDTTMVLFDLRQMPLETRVTRDVFDLDELSGVSATAFESRRIHVDELNCDFQSRDGIWVQDGTAKLATTAARDTAYAKASAAFRVADAFAEDVSTRNIYRYNGSAWVGLVPVHQRVPSGAVNITTTPTALAFDTATTDDTDDGCVTYSAGVFTVVRPGLYRISVDVGLNATAATVKISIQKNGPVSIKRTPHVATTAGTSVARVCVESIALAAGNTITVIAESSVTIASLVSEGGYPVSGVTFLHLGAA